MSVPEQDGAPVWLDDLATKVRGYHGDGLPRRLRHRRVPPGVRTRQASVLMLMGGSLESGTGAPPADADVLLTQRAATLRQHSGQVAFPGGAADAGETDPVVTALREAEEETGLLPVGVQPLAVMPSLYIPPSGFMVSPVLAYWREPSPVRVVDSGETARVVRVPLRSLIDPANRFQVRYRMIFKGPAFSVEGLLVWGFTAGLLSALIAEAGWEEPWDSHDVRELNASLTEADAGVLDR